MLRVGSISALLLYLVAGACSASSGGSGSDGGNAGVVDATSGPGGPACTALDVCTSGFSDLDIPGNVSAIVAAGNEELCTLALNAVQEGGQQAPGGPSSQDNNQPTPPLSGICAPLYKCCPSITERGGADTCSLVASEDYDGEEGTPDTCTPAVRYFQGLGFCKSILFGSGSGPTH